MTDLELKKFLAEQLPEKILSIETISNTTWFSWCDRPFGNSEVRDTEWLHITRLVEEELDEARRRDYMYSLYENFTTWQLITLSWQPRATAMKQFLDKNV